MFKTKIHIHVAISCGKSYWKLITSVFNGKSMRDESFEHSNPGLTWSFKPNSGMKHIKIKVSKAETRLHREVQQSRMQVSNHGEITRVSGQPKSVLPGVYSVEGQMFWHRNWHHRYLSNKFSVADAWCRHETWVQEVNNPKHVTSKFIIWRFTSIYNQKHNFTGRLMDRNERKMSRVKKEASKALRRLVNCFAVRRSMHKEFSISGNFTLLPVRDLWRVVLGKAMQCDCWVHLSTVTNL